MSESELNEVRTLFAGDARGFLDKMEAATTLLLEAQALAPKALEGLVSRRPFQSLDDAAQSVRGSASSVEADFLADTAAIVEELSRRGTSALDLMVAHAKRAHAIATFCADATREMRAMVGLYVDDAGEEASWLAMVLRERADEVKKSDDEMREQLVEKAASPRPNDTATVRPPVPPAVSTAEALGDDDAEVGDIEIEELGEEEFAFEDDADDQPEKTTLSHVFQNEAREILLALKGHIEAFLRTNALHTLDPSESLINTLAGSAAAVDLPYLSAQAKEAAELLSAIRHANTVDGADRFVASVNKLLATVAIAPIDSASMRKPPPEASVPDVFVGELQRVIESAVHLVEKLEATPGAWKDHASEAGKLFHRLKGTALIVGAESIADEAAALMTATRTLGDAATLATAIREGAARLTNLLPQAAAASAAAFDDAPSLPPPSVPRARSIRPSEHPNFISDGLLAIFREEVASIVPAIVAAVATLAQQPRDPGALESLYRLFHTLKGTAAAVGQPLVSAGAAAIEEKLEATVEDPTRSSPELVAQVTRDARVVLDTLGLGAALDEFAPPAEILAADISVEDVETPSAAEWDALVARCTEQAEKLGGEPDEDRNAELDEIFKEEVEQLGPSITEAFEQLIDAPTELGPVRVLERILHTLKGSAATVERRALSAAAENLRSAFEAVGRPDSGIPLTVARVVALQAAVEQLIEAATVRADMPSIVAPAPEAEYSFEEPSESPPDDELLKIFQQEARESLIALQGHVETLLSTPQSVYAAEYIERLFHTLKGAAATVGLADVAKQAADLQSAMEELLAEKRPPTPQFMESLLTRTNQLLTSIGVAPLVFNRAPDSGSSEGHSSAMMQSSDDVERKIFTGEVKSICRQASSKARELLGTTDPANHGNLRSELADLFHRLKGTAATVGATTIAREAERATEAARGKLPVRDLVDVVRATIVRIADLAGFERVRARTGQPRHEAVRENVNVPEDGELWDAFDQECSEILDGLEKAVLSLEEAAQPKQSIEEIFRLTHTLKGAVNTVGLSPTGKVLHSTEDFLEELGKAPIMPPMRTVASVLVEVIKDVRQNLRTARGGWVETSLASVESMIDGVMRPRSRRDVPKDRPSALGTGGMVSMFDSAALFGTVGVRAERSANGSHKSGKSPSQDDSAAMEERAYIRVATSRLDALMNLAGELVVSRSRLSSRVGTLRFMYAELGRSRERLTSTVDTFRDQYEWANLGGRGTRQVPQLPQRRETAAGREAFGELELDEYEDIHVLSRSLAEIGNDFEEAFRTLSSELAQFSDDAESLGGIITGIQGEVTRARMVPLDAVFARLRFPVRDAAERDGKEVTVVTEGSDVNIDKTIADAILQPMLHLVRNAVAHGIESPARRQALGKVATGTVRLSARQESGQIVIEVADDGAGLDLPALRARGIMQGLIGQEVTIDDPRVRDLVFAAGLSTKEVVGDVAGRGVGGEVVKRSIERLNGAIRVDSRAGKGTVFAITLPITLAITRALLIRDGSSTYAIPLYFAERILDPEVIGIGKAANERRVRIDGVFHRVRSFAEYLQEAVPPPNGPALVLRVGDDRLILQVDAVLGQEEIVVKKAGELLEGHPLFAGVTLRGTGDLVLIVDVPGVLAQSGAMRRTDDVAGPTKPAGDAPAEKKAKVLLAPKAEPKQAPPKLPAAKSAPLAGVRALVVDDSLSVRKVAEAHLKNLGVDVAIAVDGVDGLAKLREGRFDVVFTDLEMPRMHGYDFIRQMRLLAVYKDLPIVVVSSRSGQKHQDHARSVGATDYLTKPFSAQSLESTIRKWLRK